MSERYPVGTQVQVKNGGHGSQFRSETERVGEFAGTVIATNGPDFTGIPEVCVESATGERRVIQVGDLEAASAPTPRPTMKRINVTAKMADALGITIEINGRQAMIMSHPKTQAALFHRGLATHHGYLTDQGRFVAHLISLGTSKRSWSWDTIEAGTRTWLSDQERHASADLYQEPKGCGAVDECDLDACGKCSDCKHKPVEGSGMEKVPSEFQVKIWYVENGYEEIDHAPAHVATAIYAECEENPRVVAAEIHGCATHKLYQSFGRELDASPVVG